MPPAVLPAALQVGWCLPPAVGACGAFASGGVVRCWAYGAQPKTPLTERPTQIRHPAGGQYPLLLWTSEFLLAQPS